MNDTTRWAIGIVLTVAVMTISGLTGLGVANVLNRVDTLERHQRGFQEKLTEKIGIMCSDIEILKHHQNERLYRERNEKGGYK